jgi:ketosteroid isomerase-like protein
MKKLICLTILLAFAPLGFSQKASDDALQSMVKAERAFAAMAEQKGIRESFMAFIADDGILFRPTAVKGKQWMTEHPLPASDKRPLLSWQPTFADVARSADLGYTTGPWEYKENVHDAKPVAFGSFLTVWKKQADGTWKFAIDLGISNPQPMQSPVALQPPKSFKQAAAGRAVNVKSETAALQAREREFSNASASRGAQKAFDSYASDEVRVFRNDMLPFVGKTMALAALPASSTVWTWELAFGDVSQAGDLGYSYGTYWLRSNDATSKTLETGNYYRVWKKQGKTWKVVADLIDPVAAPKKN